MKNNCLHVKANYNFTTNTLNKEISFSAFELIFHQIDIENRNNKNIRYIFTLKSNNFFKIHSTNNSWISVEFKYGKSTYI